LVSAPQRESTEPRSQGIGAAPRYLHMNVSVFGLGYVGCVTAACLARDGHHVTGIDINAEKVDAINEGRSPIVEPRLGDIVARALQDGRLRAALSPGDAIECS